MGKKHTSPGAVVAAIVFCGFVLAALGKGGSKHESTSTSATASPTPSSSTGNVANDALLAKPDSERLAVLGPLAGGAMGTSCSANRAYYRGVDAEHHAVWSVGCSDGTSYAVMIDPDAGGSTTVADCRVIKAVAGEDCFAPLGTSEPPRTRAQIEADIAALPTKVKQQAMEALRKNLQQAAAESDENKPCSVNGLAGMCLDVASCTGAHTPGHCPYSGDNVQCCTPGDPAVSQPAEPEGLLCCDGTMSPSCSCGGSHRGCCSHHGGVCGCR
jgi:hypothetical protein